MKWKGTQSRAERTLAKVKPSCQSETKPFFICEEQGNETFIRKRTSSKNDQRQQAVDRLGKETEKCQGVYLNFDDRTRLTY